MAKLRDKCYFCIFLQKSVLLFRGKMLNFALIFLPFFHSTFEITGILNSQSVDYL